jgi:hypothetical protein
MDIPDLPINSFKHIGDYKIKPQGGGGFIEDIGSGISDAVSGVGDLLSEIDPGQALGDVVQSVGNVGEQAIQGIGNVGEQAIQGIGDVGVNLDQAVNQLPGGWTLPAAIAATIAAPYAAPYLAEAFGGGEVLGGLLSAETAFTPAEIMAAGGFVPTAEGASFVLPAFESVGAAAPSLTSAVEAASVAKTATDAATAAKVAAETVAGAKSATETLGLLSNPIIKSALTGSGMGALTGGVTSLLTGQDALKGALIGGATGGILGGGEAALFPGGISLLSNPIANAGLVGAGRGAAGGALNTLLGGGDLKKNMLYNAIGGGALGAGAEYFFPSASSQFSPKEGEAPRWASVKDSLQNANQSLDYFNNLKFGEVSNMGYAGEPYSGMGINPALRTGGGYDVLSPDYITNRGGYGVGGYSGIGLDPAIEQLYGGIGLNPNLNYNTAGLANTAEALSQASGVDINRAEFAGRGGLTADQEAALDRALTAADYATPSSWFSGLGNLGALLGAKALGGLGGGGGAAAKGAAGGSFVPKGMVDYSGILNLLAPKTSTRSSLLG